MSVKKKPTAAVIHGRFSYLHPFEPRKATETSDPRYSTALWIPKETPDGKRAKRIIDECVEAAIAEGIKKCKKWEGERPEELKMQFLKDGDSKLMQKKQPQAKGHWILNCSSKDRPSVVDADMQKILDPRKVYSGGYGCIYVNFFPFEKGSNGIGCGLNHIMWLKDGDLLGDRESADDAFGDVEEVDLGGDADLGFDIGDLM